MKINQEENTIKCYKHGKVPSINFEIESKGVEYDVEDGGYGKFCFVCFTDMLKDHLNNNVNNEKGIIVPVVWIEGLLSHLNNYE